MLGMEGPAWTIWRSSNNLESRKTTVMYQQASGLSSNIGWECILQLGSKATIFQTPPNHAAWKPSFDRVIDWVRACTVITCRANSGCSLFCSQLLHNYTGWRIIRSITKGCVTCKRANKAWSKTKNSGSVTIGLIDTRSSVRPRRFKLCRTHLDKIRTHPQALNSQVICSSFHLFYHQSSIFGAGIRTDHCFIHGYPLPVYSQKRKAIGNMERPWYQLCGSCMRIWRIEAVFEAKRQTKRSLWLLRCF